MYPSLPALPGPGGPQQGPQGGVQPIPPGGAVWQPNGVASLLQGLGNFATNYMLAQKKEEEDAQKKLVDALQMAQATGVPLDDKQVAKLIKKAKLPIALDPESAKTFAVPQKPGSGPQSSIAPPAVSGASAPPIPQGGPASPSMTPEQMMMLQSAYPGANTPPPQQGQITPMQAATSQQPRGAAPTSEMPSAAKPFSIREWLAANQKLGRMGMYNKMSEEEVRASMMATVKGALQGNPEALEMASRTGMLKTLGSHDELFLLAHRMYPELTPAEAQGKVGQALIYDALGGPGKDIKVLDMAQSAFKEGRFDSLEDAMSYVTDIVSGKEPSVQPQMSFERFKQQNDVVDTIMKQFPTAGVMVPALTAALTAGDQKTATGVIAYIAKTFPSKEMIGAQQWSAEQAVREKNSALDEARFNEGVSQFAKTYALNQAQEMRLQASGEFDAAWRVYSNKDASNDQKNEAAVMLAGALNKMSVPVTVDNVKGLFSFIHGTNVLRADKKTSVDTAKMFAGKPAVNPATGQEDESYTAQLWQFIKDYWGDYFAYTYNRAKGKKE